MFSFLSGLPMKPVMGQLPLPMELREGSHEADWFNSGAGLLVGFFSRLTGSAIRL
jgi:hypothetical protein